MSGSRDDFLRLLRTPAVFWVWFVLSVLTIVAGPLGTYTLMPFHERVLFWPVLNALSLFVAYVLCLVCQRVQPRANVWVRDAVLAILFAAIFTPMVGLALRIAMPDPMSLTLLFVEVVSISLSVAVLHRLIRISWPYRNRDQAETANVEAPRLLRRLEGVSADELLRMTVDDHYVEVVLRDRPNQRLLMRFGDAVDEALGIDGFCVHRSHWVARSAIAEVVSVNGREAIMTVDGSRVPVSRTYRPNLIEAGLIDLEKGREAD